MENNPRVLRSVPLVAASNVCQRFSINGPHVHLYTCRQQLFIFYSSSSIYVLVEAKAFTSPNLELWLQRAGWNFAGTRSALFKEGRELLGQFVLFFFVPFRQGPSFFSIWCINKFERLIDDGHVVGRRTRFASPICSLGWAAGCGFRRYCEAAGQIEQDNNRGKIKE